ncbi:MAG: TraR/DksA C4-type zinc finger protein [Syntrophobacter sp.]
MEKDMLRIFKSTLETRLGELLNNRQQYISKLSVPLNGEGPMDEGDVASSHQDRELMHILQYRNSTIIRKIRSALLRMESGEFGTCHECSDPISLGRLRAQPTTILCLNCKRELELNSKTRAA